MWRLRSLQDDNDHVASIEHYEYKVPEGTGKEVEGLTREELAERGMERLGMG